MVQSLDIGIRADDLLEDGEFRTTEILAGDGGSADRAMILDQHERAVLFAPFGHVAFTRADFGELRHALLQTGDAIHLASVARQRLAFAGLDQFFEAGRSERALYRAQQLHRQFSMCVGETGIAGLGQLPQLDWPADAARFSVCFDKTFGCQLGKLLARVFSSRAQGRTEIRSRLRPPCLQQCQQAVSCRA